jgi:hypothetical protein
MTEGLGFQDRRQRIGAGDRASAPAGGSGGRGRGAKDGGVHGKDADAVPGDFLLPTGAGRAFHADDVQLVDERGLLEGGAKVGPLAAVGGGRGDGEVEVGGAAGPGATRP